MARFQQEALRVIAPTGMSFEIVFVDDGSQDRTMANLKALWDSQACPMQIIRFSRNFGKEAAILAGLRAAKGEWITLVDGDLQQPLETVLAHFIEATFLRPKKRLYKTNNFYAVIERQNNLDKEVYSIVHKEKTVDRGKKGYTGRYLKSEKNG